MSCDIRKISTLIHGFVFATWLTLSCSFSTPLVFDFSSSNEGVVAVRVAIRSLGVCRRRCEVLDMPAGQPAEAEASDDVCYAPQTPEEARACVGKVSAVAFEVRLTCAQ